MTTRGAPEEIPPNKHQAPLSAVGSPELARGRAHWALPARRRREVVGRRQVAAGGERVASWPPVWRGGFTGLAVARENGRRQRGEHEHRQARLAMLSRYSHVRMEAKRHVLDEIAGRQRAAGESARNKPIDGRLQGGAQSVYFSNRQWQTTGLRSPKGTAPLYPLALA